MQEFTRADIIGTCFTTGRRRGYDILQVDRYLVQVAEYVGWLQGQLERYQATERAALDVLQQAQRVADETVVAAQRDAETVRRKAASGLENARQDARAILDAARSEADTTLLSARVYADSDIERSRVQVAGLETVGVARSNEVDRLVEDLRSSAVEYAAELRSAASRLAEMADHFEFEVTARSDLNETHDDHARTGAEGKPAVADGAVALVEDRIGVTDERSPAAEEHRAGSNGSIAADQPIAASEEHAEVT